MGLSEQQAEHVRKQACLSACLPPSMARHLLMLALLEAQLA